MDRSRPPSFSDLQSSSLRASRAARGASRKSGTQCENLLIAELRNRGFQFATNDARLPGTPDIVFAEHRLVCFCDGDFWHGRRLGARVQKLARGSNAAYWVEKIRTNVVRDRAVTGALKRAGWTVIRLWETDIRANVEGAADRIARAIRKRSTASATQPSSPPSSQHRPASSRPAPPLGQDGRGGRQ